MTRPMYYFVDMDFSKKHATAILYHYEPYILSYFSLLLHIFLYIFINIRQGYLWTQTATATPTMHLHSIITTLVQLLSWRHTEGASTKSLNLKIAKARIGSSKNITT